MISLIVGLIMLSMGLLAIVLYVKHDDDIKLTFLFFIAAVCFAASIYIPLISLSFGMSIHKQKNMLFKKYIIETVLNNEVSYDIIKEAEKYNHDVQYGNNYWCRFNIEDRSEYIINIDSYLEQSNEEGKSE